MNFEDVEKELIITSSQILTIVLNVWRTQNILDYSGGSEM